MDDDRPDLDEPRRAPADGEPEVPPGEARPDAAPPPVELLELTGREGRIDDGEGCRRPALVGVLTLAVLFVLLLLVGLQMTRRTMWMTVDRALVRARRAALEAPLEPEERERLVAALGRLPERLRSMDDPYPAIGAFLGRVQGDLEDGRLSRDEALGMTELVSDLAAGRVTP